MYDPISVDTALVSANGDLLIQLTDGNIINAGKVRGAQGPQGERGLMGMKGDPGRDGVDGAQWHTGVGTPEVTLGENGDLYMDVASALIPIWQKVNGDWLFLANLKPTPQFTGGGEGAAGGGGSVIIHPGPQPPIVDNDDRPIQEGDLWVDINGNHLYVYYNGVWSEVTTCSVGGGGTGDYVKRKGDSMYGDLLFKWDEKTDDDDYLLSVRTNNTYNPKQRNFNGDYPEFKVANSLYLGPKDDQSNSGLEIYAAVKGVNYGHYLEVSGLELWSAAYGTDGNITSTLTHRYNGDFDFRSAGTSAGGGFYVDVHNQDPNSKVSFYANTSIEFNTMSGYELYLDEQNGLTYNATIVETDDPKTVTNKEYVDSKDEFIQRKIEVLQEEIESFAPTTDKGIWQDGASATPGTGHFAMRREGGAITQNYEDTDIDTIIISTTAKDGSGHSFLTEEVGDLIQLFDVEDKNYGLFEIEAIDTTSSSEYVSFDVKWLQGLGETHVDDDVLIKTFAPPTGGTASEFLPLAGGVMIGEVQWNKSDSAAFSGINLVTSISDPNVPDDDNGRVFYANLGASYSAPRVLCGVPPTEPQSVVNKKYVDNLFDFSQYEELT